MAKKNVLKEQKFLGGSMKNFNNLDLFFFKLGVTTFVLFLVSVIPAFAKWVMDTHWGWFLGIFVVCWIVVMKKYWSG